MLAVIAAHSAVLFGIYPTSAVETHTTESRTARVFQATLLAAEPLAVAGLRDTTAAHVAVQSKTLRPMQSQPEEGSQVPGPVKAGIDEKPHPMKELPPLQLEGFLKVNEVDSPASPIDDFGDALQQRLPLILASVVIEFWIAQDGTTVQAVCFEGDCPASVTDSLGNLLDLRFQPAVKGGFAVSSRKLVQIEPHASL